MNKFIAGDKVKRITGYYNSMAKGDTDVVVSVIRQGEAKRNQRSGVHLERNGMGHDPANLELVERPPIGDPDDSKADATDPNYYKFPGGAEVRHISAHLTSFGGQALQYIARSTRLDGNNKGDTIENLEKARLFLEWEIDRLKA